MVDIAELLGWILDELKRTTWVVLTYHFSVCFNASSLIERGEKMLYCRFLLFSDLFFLMLSHYEYVITCI